MDSSSIVWAYKIILFPSEIQESHWLMFLLLGIESCFFEDMAAVSIPILHYGPLLVLSLLLAATPLASLTGSRAVPLLATLFLPSYNMKLIINTLVTIIAQYPQNTSYVVWYRDGNLRYCNQPHFYLFLYQPLLLLYSFGFLTHFCFYSYSLRRMSHLRLLKWINKFAPVYGTMLLVQGIFLVILTATLTTSPEMNILILSLPMNFFFFFISVKNVYKLTNYC